MFHKFVIPMKKYLLVVLILISCTSFAQLTEPLPIKHPTIRADFRFYKYTGNKLWTIGYNFAIRSFIGRSTDQGDTWQIDYPSIFKPDDNINALAFPTETTGYVGGSNGVIYKTTTSGTIWTEVTDTNVYMGGINDIHFFDEQNGLAAGSNSKGYYMIRTTNGGQTWTGVTTPTTSTCYQFYFDTPQNGWVTTGSGRFMRTTDGGATWTLATVTGTTSTIYSIRKADASTYFMTGTAGQVYRSTDGGVSFASVTSPANLPLYSSEFTDANNGYVFGSNGAAYRTTNGGTNWTVIPELAGEVIRGSIRIGNRILTAGYRSTMHISTDAGLTWTNPTSPYRDFWGIYKESATNYITCGDRGEIHYTTNGGGTWTRVPVRPTTQLLYDVVKFGNYIYASGRNGEFHRSSNLGVSWTSSMVGSNTTRHYKMFFFNETTGFMVNNDGNIYYTTDRGANWTSRFIVPSTILYDIKFVNTQLGYAVGSGERIFKTTDGGTTWANGNMVSPAGQLLGLYMLNDTVGYVTGENGAVFRTYDGFQSVFLMTDTVALAGKLMHDVFAYDINNVYAVGQGGTFLRTINASQFGQWGQTLYGEDLIAVDGRGSQGLVLCGADGTVYFHDGILPVELTSFTAKAEKGKVTLEWITSSEVNNRGFAIERNTNGTWNEIGFVAGAGNSAVENIYSYTDRYAPEGMVQYRLRQMDFSGTYEYSSVIEVNNSNVPDAFALEQNYPNPFNPATTFSFTLAQESDVTLSVFDIQGNKVADVINEKMQAGRYAVDFNASELSSGVYIYKITAGTYSAVRKMTLLK
ncbi:MAG: T9SS type A sorting domain-containing protein [Ignavibacteriaceae bacterium]|nr:T9SS type A sorting domain-containing protein [Ignavibacteriaceae bacterium]